ncbi:MAG: hypothetical protein QHC90_04235 [Shinella sp.]|nr:hypothetical protein [Shinella sp.]
MKTYRRFENGIAVPGSIVVKFYHSGDEIRGYVRRLAEPGQEDETFPGEEMAPREAFEIAESHARGDDSHPIFVELTEGVEWDDNWGTLV